MQREPPRVQRRSAESLASPPFSATRCASEGAFRTTSIRWPTSTLGCAPPTRPRHDEAAETSERCFAPLTPKPTTSSIAASAMIAGGPIRRQSGNRRIRIERKISRRGDRLDEAGGRGDHGGVVRAELEWRGGRLRQLGAQLRVGGHPADDCDPLGAGLLGGLERPPEPARGRSRAGSSQRDRPGASRGRPCAPRRAAPSSRPKTKSPAPVPARPGRSTPPGRPRGRAGRARRRRGSRDRADARPCRTPRRPRRRSSCRSRGRHRAPARRRAACARRSPAGRGRAARAGRARGRARRRDRAGG